MHFLFVIACVVHQHLMYWLLSDALTFIIKLYVKLCKEKLELQTEVDAIEEMDMRTKVKQLGGANKISWATTTPLGDSLLGVYFGIFLE